MIAKTKTIYHLALEEAKEHCRLRDQFIQDDKQIRRLIKAAVEFVEGDIEKDIAYTSNVLTRNEWGGSVIRVNEGNLISITSITTTESGGSPQALSDFTTYVYRDYFRVDLDTAVSTDLLTVNFITGYAADAIPWDLRQACLIKVSDFYDVDRSSSRFVSIKDTVAYDRIVNRYKAYYFDYQREA
jgi:uncharacterized phiE125 gp8 family phage protein